MTVPRPAPVDTAGLRQWLVGHADAMVDDLAAYVSIETPSNDKACLARGLDWITGLLVGALGEPAARRTTSFDQYGDAVALDYPGTGTRRVVLLCHYDTVWEAGTIRDWPFARHGNVATGPGVFDMKSGLIQAVWALRALSAAGLPRPPVRLVLNGDEELGSVGSRSVIEAEALGADAVLVMEPSAAGAVKTARKGVGIFTIDVRGVEAHAGLDPEKGASAIGELARLVLVLHGLTDLSVGTSLNVGVVQGGTRSNVVAGHANALLDVRIATIAQARRIDAALAALQPSDPRLDVTIGGGWNRPVMERTPPIAAMFDLARDLAAAQGLELCETAAGGGSDGNFLADSGVPLLDGLGAVGDGAHGRGEHVRLDAMPGRTALVAAILHSFAVG